jgi:hypothetical protein
MNDEGILARITALVREEQELFSDDKLEEDEARRLGKIQVELDQCWDLLRQRRAKREFNQNPEDARLRPPSIVENYEQ